MHARNRTWPLGSDPAERCRQRTLPVEGGDGSTLTLDFTTGVLDPRLTFTRSSNATFINSSGLVQFADANMVINADFVGGNTPTSWGGSPGVNLTTPSTGVRRAVTTTAATNYIQSGNFSTSSGITYSTSVYVNEVSGQHYTDTLTITGSATTIGYYRNGVSVNQYATALSGLITVVWTATGTHGVRVGIGSTGSNVANAICEFTQPRTVQGNVTQPAFFANSSTTAAYHGPRFDHDPTTLAPRGLLIEGSAPTLNSYGEDYTNAYWTKVGSTVGSTSVAGPDNVSAATRRIVENSATAQHGIRRGITTTAGQTYTISVFVKPGSYDSFGLEVFWSASYNAKAEVTSISGNTETVTSASGVNATLSRAVFTASGWYRYALTFTHPLAVGAATPDFNVFVKQTAAYAGNSTNYMDVYGFMVEQGSGASSYIPTGASTGSRVADHCTMPTSSFITGTLYPQTLFVDCIPATPSGAFLNIARLYDRTGGGTLSYGNEIYYYTAATMSVQRKVTASTNTDRSLVSGLAYNTRHKFATSIDSSAFLGSYDGSTATGATTAPAALPTVATHLGVGCNGDATAASVMFGTIRQIKFWPTALSQSAINALTTL